MDTLLFGPADSCVYLIFVQALLTDFGLAKEFHGNGRSNSLCGTVEYMSPEIILGKGHDKAADWWSVGILLYKMLTGKVRSRVCSLVRFWVYSLVVASSSSLSLGMQKGLDGGRVRVGA